MQEPVIIGRGPEGGSFVSVLASRRYLRDERGRLAPDPSHEGPQTEPLVYEELSFPGRYQPSVLRRDTDLYPARSWTDLIIQGIARSADPVTSLDVTLRCTGAEIALARTIRVTGDRRVTKLGGRLALSDPEPFCELPVRYDRAFGGTDEVADELHRDPDEDALYMSALGEDEHLEFGAYSYPRNPAGRGYCVDPERAEGLPWPNLEFPEEPVELDRAFAPMERWGERPSPACFDWLSHACFPRCAFYGYVPPTFDERVPARERGLVDEDAGTRPLGLLPTPAGAQGCHPDLLGHRLRGDELIRVSAMSPTGAETSIALPGRPPTIEFRLAGEPLTRLRPMLDLVFVETEEQAVTLLWRASRMLPEGQEFTEHTLQSEHRVSWDR